MRKHSKAGCNSGAKSNRVRAGKKARASAPATSSTFKDSTGFVRLLLERITLESLQELDGIRRHPAGRKAAKLTRTQLLIGLVFHFTLHLSGTLGEHLFLLTGIRMAQSSLSERRGALPFEVFKELLKRVLRPLRQGTEARQGYYKGLHLVAIDGVNFSLPNTPDVQARCRKGGNQRSRAAFAKLACAVLVELAVHNPLAARLGLAGESEWCLAKQLVGQLPNHCLLLADRLYGCGAFVVAVLAHLKEVSGHFLFRARDSIKAKRLQRLKDESWLVEIAALETGSRHRVAERVVVREIYVRVQRGKNRPHRLRLWTSLLDEKKYPAKELAELYTQRWEQELYFRELKHQIGVNDLLKSQTVETAAQEVAAMIIVTSLVAEERSKLKTGEDLNTRISFIKTWQMLEPLWLTLSICSDLLSEDQKEQMADRFRSVMSRLKMQKKRARSCPRVLRQPIQPWPRKKLQREHSGPVSIAVIPAARA